VLGASSGNELSTQFIDKILTLRRAEITVFSDPAQPVDRLGNIDFDAAVSYDYYPINPTLFFDRERDYPGAGRKAKGPPGSLQAGLSVGPAVGLQA
jgi:hypothetical protein